MLSVQVSLYHQINSDQLRFAAKMSYTHKHIHKDSHIKLSIQSFLDFIIQIRDCR